jgi:hypothetical protein
MASVLILVPVDRTSYSTVHNAQCRKVLTTCIEHIMVPSDYKNVRGYVSCSSFHTICCCHYTMHEQNRKMPIKYIVYIMVSLCHRKVICGRVWLVDNEKLIKATRSVHVTLQFFPLAVPQQYTLHKMDGSLSVHYATGNNKLQHSHCWDNQNSSQYTINVHAHTAEF